MINKKVFIKVFILSLLGLILLFFIIVDIRVKIKTKEQHSFFHSSKNIITQINQEDQQRILETYMIKFPDGEDVSVYGFDKYIVGNIDDSMGFNSYMVDFIGIGDIDKFREINRSIFNENVKLATMTDEKKYYPAIIIYIYNYEEDIDEYRANITELYLELWDKYNNQ